MGVGAGAMLSEDESVPCPDFDPSPCSFTSPSSIEEVVAVVGVEVGA